MNRAKFSPLQPPQGGMTAQWAEDVQQRILSLFLTVDPEQWEVSDKETIKTGPTNADWRRLAILLAFKHGEPGFAVATQRQSRAAADDEILRDDLMDKFIHGTKIVESGQTSLSLSDKEVMSATKASVKVHKLLTDAVKHGRYTGKVPAAQSIRSQYSKRLSERRRGDQPDNRDRASYLEGFLLSLAIMDGCEKVSGAMTNRCDVGEVVVEEDYLLKLIKKANSAP